MSGSRRARPARLLLYSAAPRSDRGGVQRMMARLEDILPAYGLTVFRAGPDEPRAPGHHRLSPEANATVTGRRDWSTYPRVAASAIEVAALLARLRPEVVNVHFLTGAVEYFIRLRPVFGYRLVLSVHGGDLLRPSPPMRARLGRMLRAADRVTVVSEELGRAVATFAPDLPPERLCYIPNGADLAFWSPGAARVRPGRLVAAGRLLHVKGFDLLIEAMGRLPESTEAVILGNGEERAALEAMIARAGLGGRITLPGYQPPEVLREELRGAELFVMPSRGEGMPLALIEALACGCPAVATDVGGIPQLLTPEAGTVVPAEDAAALGRALAEAVAGKAAFSRAGARARAEQFSEAMCYARYADLLRRAAGRDGVAA